MNKTISTLDSSTSSTNFTTSTSHPSTGTVVVLKQNTKKNRAETWSITQTDMNTSNQLQTLQEICHKKEIKKEQVIELKQNIRQKLYGYRRQDLAKGRFGSGFIDEESVYSALCSSELKCYYCHLDVSVLYENRLDKMQWTLDRIDNHRGHDTDNVVIACLKCNVIRRTTNDKTFYKEKNLVVNMIH